ncbi:MAG: hypothetical protein N2044_10915 [Cyclobacteriaceae bacterium]|nr:hypothetical protein [Cyclobacteriaceae bacterium]MCX7638342.1 hypothetical protein [Cyclobacteriaceae bacterium]MDW8331137.1 hypothetical protein [Cyclobacteriaceae bacterium]
MESWIELLKILIPAALVVYAAYLLVRSFIVRDLELKRMEVRNKSIETVLPLRLQAYERMTLFLERIHPHNLLVRVNPGNIPARDFQQLLLSEIRNEYNHNVSQQVFMSSQVWELIRNAKEDLVLTINEAAAELNGEATSLDLSRKIFERYLAKPDAIQHAIEQVKQEIQQTF